MTRAPWRRLATIAGVALGAIAFASAGTLSFRASREAPRAFSHVNHVPKAWLTSDEVARDCRGCHAFGPGAGAGDAASVCANCHAVKGQAFAVTGDLATLESGGMKSFRHAPDHGSLACKECHLESAGVALRDIEADLPIERGVVSCVRCHASDDAPLEFLPAPGMTADAIDTSRLRTRLLARLNDDDAEWSVQGAFRHAEHIVDFGSTTGGAGAQCDACHGSVAASTAEDLGRTRFQLQGCDKCHRDGGGRSTLATQLRDGPSASAFTFAHKDHLRGAAHDPAICGAESHASVQSDRCGACHAPSTSGDAGGDWSRGSAEGYAGCVVCHGSAAPEGAWRTKDHGQWSGCSSCHTFGAASMRTDRPLVSVVRMGGGEAEPVTFSSLPHAHPEISAGDRSKACVDCHRAGVPRLPSRLGGRAFRHATHLSGQPTDDDCRRCHVAVADAANSTALGVGLQGGGIASYDPKACDACHRPEGSMRPVLVESVPASSIQRRSVVEFPHASHVGKEFDGVSMSCVTCHDSRGDDAGRVGFVGLDGARVAAVETCVRCHDHRTETGRYAHTGDIHGADVESCAKCHTGGVPELGSPRQTSRLEAIGNGAQQHHPSDARCADCHVVQAVRRGDDRAEHVFLAAAPAERHGRYTVRERANCMGCHWHVSAPGMPISPITQVSRRAVGNLLEGYPGVGATPIPR